MSFGRLIHKPWKNYKLFKGTWDHRLAGLFECGVDYHGKSILDAGCNSSGMFVAKSSEPIAHEFSAVMERHRYRIAYGSDPKGRLFTFVKQ